MNRSNLTSMLTNWWLALFLVSLLSSHVVSGKETTTTKTTPRAAFALHSPHQNSHGALFRSSPLQRRRQVDRQRQHQQTGTMTSATMMIDPASSMMLLSESSSIGVSPEPIHTAFTVANFFPQPFWLLMIVLPKSDITKKIMGGLDVVLLCCLVHFFIVVSSIVVEGSGATAPLAEFNDVFDPFGDPQKAFIGMVSSYPNFVAEEWSHVLTWDLFIGRYIWLDGLKRNIFTSHSVLLSNLIGPPGLLLHWLTCTIIGKPLLEQNEAFDEE